MGSVIVWVMNDRQVGLIILKQPLIAMVERG